MKKKVFKLAVICISLLFLMGILTTTGETDEPGPIGDNIRVVMFM
jgi:hypothetical protein